MSNVQVANECLQATLDSIASELNTVAEKLLTDEISEEDAAFSVHDLLNERLPTPSVPAHLEVLKRLKDWHQAALITKEQLKVNQGRIISSSRGSQSSSGNDRVRHCRQQAEAHNVNDDNHHDSDDSASGNDSGVIRGSRVNYRRDDVSDGSDDEFMVDEDGEQLHQSQRDNNSDQYDNNSDMSDEHSRPQTPLPTEILGVAANLKPGDIIQRHDVPGDATVVRWGSATDFLHNGSIYISYQHLQPGCKKKMQTHYGWIRPDQVQTATPAARDTPPPRSSERVRSRQAEQQRE